MKNLISVILFIIVGTAAIGQSFTPMVFASGSKQAKANNVRLSYTIGQVFAPTVISPGGATLSQGFQQPAKIKVIPAGKKQLSSMKVFPNPAKDFITIELKENDNKEVVRIEIWDMMGRMRQIPQQQLSANYGHYRIRLNSLSLEQGQYILRIVPNDISKETTTFKITKL